MSLGVHPDVGGRQFQFVTDGQLHMRTCLHPEAVRKSIPLAPHYYSFFDLRREFRMRYKPEVVNCIRDMLDCILFESIYITYGLYPMTCIAIDLINGACIIVVCNFITYRYNNAHQKRKRNKYFSFHPIQPSYIS